MHAEIQQREAMDTRPAKSPEMSQPKYPGLSRVSLGRWKMVRWLGVKVHEGEVLEGETLTPSCGIPHSCPPTPRSFPGIDPIAGLGASPVCPAPTPTSSCSSVTILLSFELPFPFWCQIKSGWPGPVVMVRPVGKIIPLFCMIHFLPTTSKCLIQSLSSIQEIESRLVKPVLPKGESEVCCLSKTS